MELIETYTFTRQITALLRDGEYAAFQCRIAANPELGAVIRGGGGIRKIRVAAGSRGKRGGARVILLLGREKRRDFAALRVFEERRCRSDFETDFAARKHCQRGVLVNEKTDV